MFHTDSITINPASISTIEWNREGGEIVSAVVQLIDGSRRHLMGDNAKALSESLRSGGRAAINRQINKNGGNVNNTVAPSTPE